MNNEQLLPDDFGNNANIAALIHSLTQADLALQAAVSPEIDAVIDPVSGMPILLREAQTLLRTSDARYRRLLSRLSAIVFELNPDGTVLFVNEASAAITGYSPVELQGQNWWEIFFKGDQRRQVDTLFSLFPSRDVTNYELTLTAKNGTPIIIELNSANRYGSGGKLEHFLGIALDITQRRQAERSFSESEARYHSVIDSLAEGVLVVDRMGTILTVNSSASRIIGLPQDKLRGTSATVQFWSAVREDGTAFPPGTSPGELTMRTGQPQSNVVMAVRRTDGTALWLSVNTQPVFREDKQTPYVAISFSDITERKQAEVAMRSSEERYRLIVETAQDGIWLIDTNGITTFVNNRLCEILGYTAEEMVGQPGKNFMSTSEGRSRSERGLEERKQGISEQREEGFRRKDGSTVWTVATISPVQDSNGHVQGVVGIITDITERKRAEVAEHEQRMLAEALRDTTSALVSTLDLDTVMSRVLQNLGRVIVHESASIMLIEGDIVRVAYWNGYLENDESFLRTVTFPLDLPQFREMLTTGLPFVIPNTDNYPTWVDSPESRWIKSNVCAPIKVRGNVLGFLSVNAAQPGIFTAAHGDRLKVFADQAAIAIENAQLYDELRNYTTTLEQRVKERTDDLERAKEHVEAILDSSSDGIVLAHITRGIEQTNPAFNALLGCLPGDYLGIPLTALTSGADVLRMRSAIEDATIHHVSTPIEIQVLRKDKTVFEAEIEISPVLSSSQGPDNVVCALRDITQRKQVERELRNHAGLLEQITDAVISTDLDYRILTWNKAAETIYGWTAAEAFGQVVTDLLKTEFESGDSAASSRSHFTEKGYWNGEVVQQTKTGESVYIFGSVTLIVDDQGIPVSTVAVNHDVTERKRIIDELRQSLRRERELNEVRSRFISLVSHEFRTPLSTIQTSSDILMRYSSRLTEVEKTARLTAIQTEIRRMTTLLEEVLTISRAEAGRLTFNPVAIDLKSFCQNIINTSQESETGHRFVYSPGDDCDTHFLDPELLRHILTNLLGNAAKYSPVGTSIMLTVQCQPDHAVFSVQDEGIGIPPKDQARLFEQFYRAKNVGQVSGTGLGLAIVKQMAERHGGGITFESTLNVGSTFTVTLPMSAPIEE